MPKREDERWLGQQSKLMYCYKHKRYYKADAGCQLCVYEKLGPRLKGQDGSRLEVCPVCRQTSLFWNNGNGLYECLNHKCKKTLTRDELNNRNQRDIISNTEETEIPSAEERSENPTGKPVYADNETPVTDLNFDSFNWGLTSSNVPQDDSTYNRQENTQQIELIRCKHCNQLFSTSDFETHLKLLARSARRGAVCLKCGEPTYYLSHDGGWECLNPRCKATKVENIDTVDSENVTLPSITTEIKVANVNNVTLVCPDCGFDIIWDDGSNLWRCSNCRRVYAKEDISKGEAVIREIPNTATSPPKGKRVRWLVGSVATFCVVGGIAFFAVSNGRLQKEPSAPPPVAPTPMASMPLTPTPPPALPSATPIQRPTPTPVVTATPISSSISTRTSIPSPTPTPQLPTATPSARDETVTIDGQKYRVQFWKLDLKGRVEATVTLPTGIETNYGSNWKGFTLEQILDNARKSGNKVAWAVTLAAGAKETPTVTTPLTPVPTVSPLPPTSPTPNVTITASIIPKLQELAQYMLELINKDRRDNGLSPVVLGSNNAAQMHAEDRLKNNYMSHWGTDGMKPYMRYTLAGGYNYDAENGFVTRTTWYGGSDPFYKRDPKQMLDEAEKSLMGSPGHRRNILDKWHKKVNLGIAYSNDSLHLAQDFEGDYLTFTALPTLSGNILSMAGKLTQGSLFNVAIYYDPLPQPLTSNQLEAPPYDYSYGMGDRVGIIIPPAPPGSYYSSLPPNSIIASLWSAGQGGQFSITANISPALQRGKGVYTVMIWADINGESKDVTNYSIFVK